MTRSERIGVATLLFLLLAQTFFLMRGQSLTSDEFSHHIASGYSHLVTRDFRMNPAMPPLPRLLSAIPLYFLGAEAPLDDPSWEAGDSPAFARRFFYHNRVPMDTLAFWARVPIALLSVFFGLSVYGFARRFFGASAGILALFLYVFCPDIVAHSSLATSDLPVAFFFFLALTAFWLYLKNPSIKGIVLTGIAVGLAFLCKFTAVLLFPIFLLIALASGRLRDVAPKKTAGFLAVCLLTVWAGYFFEVKPLLQHTPDPLKKEAFIRKVGGERFVQIAEKTPLPLASFASAFTGMVFTRARGTHSFLMGRWSDTGFWKYYFVAFLVKNTIPFIFLIILGFVLWNRLALDRLSKTVLVLPVAFFFLVTMPDKADAGIRYFLPVYPLLFIWAAGAAVWLWNKGRAGKIIAAALLIWHLAEAVSIFPYDLAYFNELIGGPKNGYKYLRDSNIDWGQDLKRLGHYVEERKFPEVALFYYGPVDPAQYGIPSRPLAPDEFQAPRKTVYALGAHDIDAVKWSERYKPVKVIGYSIYVYDFR